MNMSRKFITRIDSASNLTWNVWPTSHGKNVRNNYWSEGAFTWLNLSL